MLDEEVTVGSLVALEGRMGDEKFSGELYRALANRVWRTAAGDEVSVSWKGAERIVNALRERVGAPELELAQTGGESWVSETVGEELGRLGWSSRPLDTDEHEPVHAEEPEHAPPPREAGNPALEQAHQEADENEY